MNWNDGLKGPHLGIASSNARRIGILAGPGTGKTTYGLIRRVARLVSEGVPGNEILLLTFARTAALDLKNKIADLEVQGSDDVRASTVHSYCLGLLQREAVLAITQRNVRILLPHESNLMLRSLNGNFGDLTERRNKLEAFQAGWAREIDDHPGLATVPDDKKFEREVLGWLRHHKTMLIGEVVPIAYNHLRNNSAAEELTAFKHIIVDEYQDLNSLEQRLLDLLVEHSEGNLCVAGDDDQSIYGFRFANPEGIKAYHDRNDVEPYEINVCGRCPKTVLAIANSLISHAPDRTKPPLECLQESDGYVAIIQWDDLEAEIDGTVAAIVADIQQERRAPGDILVLTHRRYIGDKIRKALRANGVQASSYFKEDGLADESAQEALAILRLVVAEDPVSLRVILGIGSGDGRTNAYKRLMKHCAANGITELDALERLAKGEKMGLVVPSLVERFSHLKSRLSQLQPDDLPALVDLLFPESEESLADLRELALESLQDAEDAKNLLEKLIVALTQVDIPQHPSFVRVMSLHKSKGLTSASVFIVGVIDGIVPTIPAHLDEQGQKLAVAEQRRLFYVAITRASKQLVMSSSTKMDLALARRLGVRVDPQSVRRTAEGFTAKTIASPYMSELGVEAPEPQRGIEWIAEY